MKVLMRSTMAGPSGTVLAGNTADLPPEQAADLLARGYAVLPEGSRPEPQTADAPPAPATAEAPKPKPKQRRRRKSKPAPAPPPLTPTE